MIKIISMPANTLKNPFSDEFGSQDDRYIEKFQEQLYRANKASDELLDSLKSQKTQTLNKLAGILVEVIETNPANPLKYQKSLETIKNLLDMERP